VANAKSIGASVGVGTVNRHVRRAVAGVIIGGEAWRAGESGVRRNEPVAVGVHNDVHAICGRRGPRYGELRDVGQRLRSGAIVAVMKPAHVRRRNDSASRWGQDRA
jgi:hypothetical protein